MTPPDTDGLTGRLLTMMGIGGTVTGVADTLLSRGPAIVLGTARRWRRPPTTLDGAPAASATTYYYRTTGGTRASTTDAGSIPAGAVVERVT